MRLKIDEFNRKGVEKKIMEMLKLNLNDFQQIFKILLMIFKVKSEYKKDLGQNPPSNQMFTCDFGFNLIDIFIDGCDTTDFFYSAGKKAKSFDHDCYFFVNSTIPAVLLDSDEDKFVQKTITTMDDYLNQPAFYPKEMQTEVNCVFIINYKKGLLFKTVIALDSGFFEIVHGKEIFSDDLYMQFADGWSGLTEEKKT